MRSYNTDIFLKINVLNLSCISENKNYDKLLKTKTEPLLSAKVFKITELQGKTIPYNSTNSVTDHGKTNSIRTNA